MFQRPFIPAALLFILGIFIAAHNVNLIIAAVLCSVLCIFIFLKTAKPVTAVLLSLFVLLGIFRMNIALQKKNITEAEYSGKKEVISLVLTGFPDGNSVTAYFEDDGKKHKILLRSPDVKGFCPGDIAEGEVSFSAPYDSDESSLGYARYLEGNNIFLLGFADTLSFTGEKEDDVNGVLFSLRAYMDKLGEKYFSSDSRGLYSAMITGDKRLLSDDLYSSLQASGLNHIAVVSGMHLSIAMAFMSVFFGYIFGKRRIGYIFVFLGALILTFLTGAGASVVRALIMCSLYILSKLFYRDADSPTALCFAAGVMIFANPFIIFNAGFILSVLSVTGILIFSSEINDFLLSFTPARLASVLSVSISAQLMVLPAVVFYFGTFTPYSLLSNTLLVPIAGIHVILGLLFVILSPIPTLSFLITCVMKFFSAGIVRVCHFIKMLPFSLVEMDKNPALFMGVCVFIIILFYLRRTRGKSLK